MEFSSDDKWYVYHHKANNKVFYVGMGKNIRAVNFYHRTDKWKKFVDSLPNKKFKVRIVKFFSSQSEALSFEKKEIIKLAPKLNDKNMISPAKLKARNKKAKEMYRLWAEEGKTYEEIGAAYKCSKQYVGQLIRNFISD